MHDIHTHLYWDSYDTDRDAVIARAQAAGVEKMFVIGCTVDESRQCVMLAEQYPEIYASVGIHPHEFSEQKSWNKKQLAESIEALRGLASELSKVIAIGECGLDYYSHDKQKTVSNEQKKFQREGFAAQTALAQELSLPLIVHCRASTESDDAYRDLFDILRATSYKLPAILHCYMGDTEVTKRFLELSNVYFSFTANITYPVKKTLVGTKDDLTETVKIVPLERLFAETDCPFLAPQERRGERNEPAYVTAVIDAIATIQGQPRNIIESAIDRNVHRVFTRLTQDVRIGTQNS